MIYYFTKQECILHHLKTVNSNVILIWKVWKTLCDLSKYLIKEKLPYLKVYYVSCRKNRPRGRCSDEGRGLKWNTSTKQDHRIVKAGKGYRVQPTCYSHHEMVAARKEPHSRRKYLCAEMMKDVIGSKICMNAVRFAVLADSDSLGIKKAIP